MKFIIGLILISQIVICQPKKVMFIGDSLIAGFQLPINQAFPAIIQEKVGTKNIQIIN